MKPLVSRTHGVFLFCGSWERHRLPCDELGSCDHSRTTSAKTSAHDEAVASGVGQALTGDLIWESTVWEAGPEGEGLAEPRGGRVLLARTANSGSEVGRDWQLRGAGQPRERQGQSHVPVWGPGIWVSSQWVERP